MNFNDLIKQVINTNTPPLHYISSVGILPNEGGIIEGFPECVLSFDEDHFRLHVFKGFLKPKFEDEQHTFSFSDIKEIEMGKYNFKDYYIKITFKDETYLAFSYLHKVRKYQKQHENIVAFIHKLESISTLETSDVD